jgi:nitrite reductase (NO-forming)
MWLINASFKWQSAFRSGFLDQIKAAADGQPHWLHGWYHFWIQILSHNPHVMAIIVAVLETLIAAALILGVGRRFTYVAATIFTLLIWSIAEGFGGPYTATSTDIGTGIVYAVVFLSLYGLERQAGKSSWSVDQYIVNQFPWWAVIANP